MRLIINKSDFKGIGTAVFYKRHKFFPSDFNIIPEEERNELNFISDLVKYHGSNQNFPSINFAEYDFSYLVNKYKFDNKLLITELDRYSQELIGKNIDDTSKIEKILFPTLVDDVSNNELSYFGSLKVNNRNIFFFDTPENYDKIEIYDGVLNSNIGEDYFIEYDYLKLSGLYENTRIIPPIVLYLGPENTLLNNPSNMYYDGDVLKGIKNREEAGGKRINDLEYSRLIDEMFGMKIVYLLLTTSNNSVLDFNVALNAWNNNNNPDRNKWKYNIRNDEYYSAKNNIEIVKNDHNIYIDKKSDTILGNYTIDSLCPIKTKKLNKLYCQDYSETKEYSLGEEVNYLNQIWTSNISFNIGNYPGEGSNYWSLSDSEYIGQYYSPYRKYMKGEKTKYLIDPESNKFMVWESLTDNNLGNDPLLSPKWILSKKLLDFKTNIIYLYTNPNNTGSVLNPNTQVTVYSSTNVDFTIDEGLGYVFDKMSLINKDNTVIELVPGVDYTYTEFISENTYNKYVSINDWSEIINIDSIKYSDSLIFNFTESPSILNLKFSKDGVIYNLSEIQNLYVNGFNLDVYIGGSFYAIPTNGKLVIAHPELRPNISFNFSGTMVLQKIVSNSRLGSTFTTSNISFNNNVASSVVNFSESTYTFFLVSEKREVITRLDKHYYNQGNQTQSVDYGSYYSLNFTTAIGAHPYIHIYSFHRDEYGNLIKFDGSDTTITQVQQYNVEVVGPEETTLVNFEQVGNNSFRLFTNNINNNLLIYLE